MYELVTKFMPKKFVKGYIKNLKYCEIKIDERKFIGFITIFSAFLAIVFSINLAIVAALSLENFIFVFLATFLSAEITAYMRYSLIAESKGRYVEKILPDALNLMALNIRSGMTTDRALISSSRPEFGPLEKELSKAAKHILAGKDITSALLDIPKNIKSDLLEKTMNLIVESVNKGGNIAMLLQQTAEDIQSQQAVESEVRASVLIYAIFIFIAAAFGAPMLFGISSHLIGILSEQFSKLSILQTAGSPIQVGEISFGADTMTTFALVSLVIISIFSSIIVGIVKSGSEKEGLRIIPLMLGISMAVFFITKTVVSSILPSIG